MKETADKLFGKDYIFSVLAVGRHELNLRTVGVVMGGSVRVGLEDNLYLSRGELAKSNADLVAKMRRIVTELSFEVATPNLNHDQLQQLSDEVGSERTLLVLCTAFRARADRYSNLTVKKIPRAVLARCEWGHDDYSLRVENLPQAPPPKGQIDLFDEE